MKSVCFKNSQGQRIGILIAVITAASHANAKQSAPTIQFGASFMHPEDQKTANKAVLDAKKELAKARKANQSSEFFGITVPKFWDREQAVGYAKTQLVDAVDFNRIPKQHRERAARFIAQVYSATYRH